MLSAVLSAGFDACCYLRRNRYGVNDRPEAAGRFPAADRAGRRSGGLALFLAQQIDVHCLNAAHRRPAMAAADENPSP